jgi:tetratricopeptide (TPR) repeat protein
MEQLAIPGSIALTPATVRLVEGLVRLNPLGPIPVKGLAEPVEVFELVGATAVRQRIQAAEAHGLTRFIGQETEMTVLAQALARAGAGHGQMVATVGEVGVGKSRLLYEFVHSHRTQGWLVLEAASVSYGKATPYFPVVELLKGYVHIEDGDEPRTVRANVTGHLLTLDEALQETIPALLALLDVLPADSPFLRLDPPQRRQRTLAALKRMLLRESQVQPLLLVFEDLHWIDAETQALLDSLVDSLPTAHMLLLVNYRPEYQHAWGSKTYYTQLRLDPLPPASADELLQALLGDDPSLAVLKQLLITRTEGNPFFLEESVRTLVETGVLLGEQGAYRLVKPLDRLQVPATVQAVLTARIDRLPPEEKRLLQTAAVIGTEVPLFLLQAIVKLPEAALHRGLAHLHTAEFLYETVLFPEHAYTFKHALTHEVAYGSLLQERWRALHAGIVEALEALVADRVAEQVERLAHHALRGEVWDKALAHLRQAGTKAFARSTLREAVAYFEHALVAVRHLPECRETLEQAIDLRLDLRNALIALRELGAILNHLREPETLAIALDDQRRLGWVSAYMANYFSFSYSYDQDRAVESGQRTLALAAASGDFALEVTATFFLGLAYFPVGNYRQVVYYHRKNIEVLVGEWLYARFGEAGLPAVSSRVYVVRSLAELGEFPEGSARGAEAVRIAETIEQPFSLADAYYGLGLLHLRQGDLPEAIAIFEKDLAVCQTGDILVLLPNVAAALGYAYALSGRLAEALPLLEQAVEQASPLRAAHLGEAYLMAGRLEDASQLAGRALARARDFKLCGNEAYAPRLLGEIAAPRDPPEVEPAAAAYQQALTLAEKLGMRPLQAHCHLSLGKLYVETGRHDAARLELTAAIELYRAMAMTFWAARAEAALAQVEGR